MKRRYSTETIRGLGNYTWWIDVIVRQEELWICFVVLFSCARVVGSVHSRVRHIGIVDVFLSDTGQDRVLEIMNNGNLGGLRVSHQYGFRYSIFGVKGIIVRICDAVGDYVELGEMLFSARTIGSCVVGGIEECIIRQRDKRRNTVVEAKEDGSFECSCGHYNRHGFLCRHVFCVFGTLGMDTIPENYISRRWRKNHLSDHLRDKRHRYGPCIEESESLASDIYSRVEDCINLIRNDPDKLKVFLAKVTDMKKELENDMSSQNEPQNKESFYEDILGVKAPDTVVIMNPNKCPNKGHRRFKSAAEKGKAIKKARTNRKVDVNESEEDEEDVEVDDVDEDDGTDEHVEDEDED
ncbi:FAR1 DNA binding domain-containing protein [Tanacetum coccineum]